MGFAATASADVVTAAWNANPESNVSSYVVSYGTTSGVHPTTIEAGNVLTRQVTLPPGFIYFFVVQARNAAGLSLKSTEVSINLLAANGAPVLNAPAAQTSGENASVSLQLVGSDPDGNPLTYSATGLPPSLTVSSTTGLISGTLSFASAGTHAVTATVSDGLLSASRSFSWIVTNVNRAPTLAQPANQSQAENTTVSLQLVGADADGTALTYSATNLPAGVSLNVSTGLVSGMPTFASAGTFNVAVTVSDGLLTATRNLTWTVINVNRTPTLTQPANRSQAENTTVSLQLVGTDPDGTTLTYSATNLPAGSSLNVSTGLISGTLTYSSFGTYAVVATVSDGSLTNTKNFTWTVTNVNRAPTLTQPANQSQAQNTAVSLQLVGADPDGTTLTYSAASLPAGASLNASTGLISGTLTSALGTFAVTTTVSDGTLSSTMNFTWTVTSVNQAPSPMLTLGRTDFDGDGRMDITVFRPSTATWYILKSSTNFTSWIIVQWGTVGDVPVPGDYDGDARTDITVYRPSTATWYIQKSTTNYTTWSIIQWGTVGDLAVPEDYDGDAKTDIAVYRPASGTWYILQSRSNFTTWSVYQWGGGASDIPVAGDYDDDGRADVAFYRPSNGTRNILKSSTNFTTSDTYAWGVAGDIP